MKIVILCLISFTSLAGVGSGGIYGGTGGETKPTKENSRSWFDVTSPAEEDRLNLRLGLVNLGVEHGLYEPLVEVRFESKNSRNEALEIDLSDFQKSNFKNDIHNWNIIPKYQRDNAVGCLNALDYANEIRDCINYELNSN